MPGDETRIAVARQWIAKADEDLYTARTLLKDPRRCPTSVVCFHVQQCVEKCVKACLVLADVAFPRTHDIGELLALLPPRYLLRMSPAQTRRLTSYATASRYPAADEPIPLKEARLSVSLARRIRASIGKKLPASVA